MLAHRRDTPHGRLTLVPSDDAPELAPELAQRLTTAFARGSGPGLLQLGGAEIGQPLPPTASAAPLHAP